MKRTCGAITFQPLRLTSYPNFSAAMVKIVSRTATASPLSGRMTSVPLRCITLSRSLPPHKIEEVRRAADGRGFPATHAAEAKVVQLEGQKGGITGAHQCLANSLLYGAAECCHRDRIPDLQQIRFRPMCQPVDIWFGV